MRWIVLFLGICAVLAAHADGFAYGLGFERLRETSQAAVINLDETTADVAMYIAIEGIPAGKTITYVLPFWYAPEGFRLQELPVEAYEQLYVDPARERIFDMNRLAGGKAQRNLLEGAATIGLGVVMPGMLLPTFSTAREKGRHAAMPVVPYDRQATDHGRVELYRGIRPQDLPQLVKQAGLPAKYAEPLRKYHTGHFAVMHLRGLPAQGRNARPAQTGVCYTFRHRIPAGQRGRYTYPLGTGAAWPQPIQLTQVYVTCPDRFALRVNAPTEGERVTDGEFGLRMRDISYYQQLPADKQKEYLANYKIWIHDKQKRGVTEKELLAPLTASILSEGAVRASAWHVAYANSNPDRDIAISLQPRHAAWRLRVARWFSAGLATFLVPILCSLLSWVLAGRIIIRPRWVHAGKPRSLIRHTLNCVLLASGWINAILLVGVLVAYVCYYAFESFTDTPQLQSIGALVLLVIAFAGGIGMVARRAKMRPRQQEWHTGLALHSWLLATAVYLLLIGGVYALVWYCQTAVTGG